jgi:hypothetical protein
MANVTGEDLKRIADEIAADALIKLTRALGLPEAGGLLRPVAFDCTGPKFTCGAYNCTGIVGCSGEFGCTIKFTG